MSGRITTGLFFIQNYFRPFRRPNSWGRFSRASFSTAEKTVRASKHLGVDICHKEFPACEQIERSPELQKKLAEMYKHQVTDPSFLELTAESRLFGKRHFEEEHS